MNLEIIMYHKTIINYIQITNDQSMSSRVGDTTVTENRFYANCYLIKVNHLTRVLCHVVTHYV